jgi:isopenicillin N synthase-like dioxygenase
MYEEKLSSKGDLKEGFDFAMELSADDKDRIQRGASLYGPNFWPEDLPGKYFILKLTIVNIYLFRIS